MRCIKHMVHLRKVRRPLHMNQRSCCSLSVLGSFGHCIRPTGQYYVVKEHVLFSMGFAPSTVACEAHAEGRACCMQSTVLMSLLQPQREVFNEADDIMLIAEGGHFTLLLWVHDFWSFWHAECPYTLG